MNNNIILVLFIFAILSCLIHSGKMVTAQTEKDTELMQNYLNANFTNKLNSGVNLNLENNSTETNTTGIQSISGASNLHMATFGGWFVYNVWQQVAPHNNSNILISVSQDGGRNYSNPVNLSNHTADPIKSINPQVGAFGDDVYITWQGVNNISGKSHVYLVNSTDGGTTFGQAVDLNKKRPQSSVEEYSLLVDKDTGKVLIGWIDDSGPFSYCGARC